MKTTHYVEIKVYTPFPDYEETVPASGQITQRTSYYLAGQLIAVRVRTGTSGNGTLYFAYADHLGNITAWGDGAGAYLLSSIARYDPFGNYRTSRRQLSIPASATAASPATG